MSPSMLYTPSTIDHLAATGVGCLEQLLEMVQVAVPEPLDGSEAQTGSVLDAGVVELVQEYGVVAPQQGPYGTEVRLVARAEDERTLPCQ